MPKKSSTPGASSAACSERDRKTVWHPYTQQLTAPPPIPIARAKGVRLYDEEGRAYIDAISSWWVNIHGHGHPRLRRAVCGQMKKLDHVIFAGFTHRPAVELADKLLAVCPPGLSRVFYSDDGSTSVEVALKLALQYWSNSGRPEKKGFAAFEKAYHGDTVGAMSVSARSVFTSAFEPLLFGVSRAAAPDCYRCPGGLEPSSCRAECLDGLESILTKRASSLAAVIVEPMLQAAGGMLIAPPVHLKRLRRLCDRHEVLLIADEVMTGFGRTGKLFACGHAGVSPDLMCLSKAITGGVLPLAATLCTGKIHEAFLSEDPARTFYHGHSYTANPIACAAALESFRIFEDEPVFERIRRIESRFIEKLSPLKALPRVGDVRVLGGVGVVELVRNKKTKEAGGYLDKTGRELAAEFLRRRVLLRPLGNVLYVMPPYTISGKDLDYVLDQVVEVVGAVGKD